MAFKLLAYHALPAPIQETLMANGIELVMGTSPTEAGMCRDLQDCDATILFEQPENGFNKHIIDAAPHLKLIARDGTGYETVDVGYAEECGIFVTNTPSAGAISVAEATMGLMIGCARNAQRVYDSFKAQKAAYDFFSASPQDRGTELYGKTLGLLGCGNIGARVASMAFAGFQMKVLAYDPYLKEYPSYITPVASPDEIYTNSDFVSLHLPSTPTTRQSIGMQQFSKMKPTAFLINASRGNIVVQEALIAALRTGVIKGAGLDVFAHEPITEESYPLFELKNVYVTPHNAAFTDEAEMRYQECIAQSILEVAQGKRPTCAVNNPKHPRCRLAE